MSNTTPIVIGLAAKKRHGKNAAARLLRSIGVPRGYTVIERGFGDALKEECAEFLAEQVLAHPDEDEALVVRRASACFCAIWSDVEVWLPVAEPFPYSISSHGRVRREVTATNTKAGKILVSGLDGNGYLKVVLCSNGQCFTRKVATLVAAAFLMPRPDGLEVNHKDTNKTNNFVTNLEYCTPEENRNHAQAVGTKVYHRGEAHPNSVLTEDTVRWIKFSLASGRTVSDLARALEVATSQISRIKSGEIWGHVK